LRTAERSEVVQILSDAFRAPPQKLATVGIVGGGGTVTRGQFAIMLASLVPIAPSASPVVTAPPSVPSSSSTDASSARAQPAVIPIANVDPHAVLGVITGAVNIRWKPDITSNALGSFPAGTQVIVVDQSNPVWYFVRLADGREGFIVRKFVRVGE
jgi:hypothetical protein